uniref:Xylanase inhibitor N-terminal domain-containing protein n=2 Tax=Brassica oleracea TaxID=3712 RepID=A0A0D3DLM3_BRAOL
MGLLLLHLLLILLLLLQNHLLVFPVSGNVYPLGYYYVLLNIENPPKVFDLDIALAVISLGSNAMPLATPRDSQYKPNHNTLPCSHMLCSGLDLPQRRPCLDPQDQCGYDQQSPGPHPPPPTAGMLGLSRGKTSISSQLSSLGVTKNVIVHCLSHNGKGFLSIGDELVPSSGVTWTSLALKST